MAKQPGADAPNSTESKQPGADARDAAKAVQLTHPYAFYDEDGSLRSWNPGQKVTGSDAALLIERGAPVVEVE
jgi:hypothetical protein